MNLVLLTQHYPPHFEGGTEAVVRAQARELAAAGHEVRVVSGTDRPHAGEEVVRSTVDGLPVAHLPRAADEGYDLALDRPRLAELVRAEVRGADLAHVHHWSTLHGSLVRDLARALPVVVTLHDLFATCPRFFRSPPVAGIACPPRGDVEPCVRCLAPDAGGTPPEVLRAGLSARAAAYRAELEAAALLVAPSRSHARRVAVLSGLLAERIEVVQHGLCRPLSRPERRADQGFPRGPLRVLHFGHRTDAKGTADLVRALAEVHAARPGAVALTLAGAELEPGYDAALRGLGGELPLAIEGTYDAARLERLAADADLAAFPSRALESYGLVVDEALALGLPVWVSDRGALAERVGAAGRSLPAADPAAWARTVMELLDDPSALARERAAVPPALPGAREAAERLTALYAAVLEVAR